MYGLYGHGVVVGSLQVKYLSEVTNLCILRTGRNHYRLVTSALASATRIQSKSRKEGKKNRCQFTLLHIGGSIRACTKQAIKLSIERLEYEKALNAKRKAKEGEEGKGGKEVEGGEENREGEENDDGEGGTLPTPEQLKKELNEVDS
eukprot:TRINITY_DN2844_c0_g4_i1.p1 TRINITY_DN2844_c0_g4~~TRINITY_DN2844_c0_g4_i1.p1  ORF type:complete len:147 (-),score=38.72 TRINITY_DN2844_c0_g4_i1:317-757(-)